MKYKCVRCKSVIHTRCFECDRIYRCIGCKKVICFDCIRTDCVCGFNYPLNYNYYGNQNI